jgi:hypothetical protein
MTPKPISVYRGGMLEFTFSRSGKVLFGIAIALAGGKTGAHAFEEAVYAFQCQIDPGWLPGSGNVTITIEGT